MASGLELHNSAAPDFWDLASSGQSVHNGPGLFDNLVDHDSLGEDLLDRAHLDFGLHVSVFHFSKHSLELGLLLVCVLVLNGLGLIGDFFFLWCTTAIGLSLAATGSTLWFVEVLGEVGKVRCGFVYDRFPAP